MNVRPLHDRLLIERVAEQEQTAGDLYIPDTAKDKPTRGTVLAVGPGTRDEDGNRVPLDVAPGDTVLFGKFAGTEIVLDGQERVILREDEVLAVLERDSGAT